MIGKNLAYILILFILMISVLAVDAADDTDGETIKININNNTFDVELENNSAARELVRKLEDGNISIYARDYGGFEKVGDLGFSLPSNDESISTSPGDIVLYQGNQISLFYESHSWEYTRLGSIKNITSEELKDNLGSGDVTVVLSLK